MKLTRRVVLRELGVVLSFPFIAPQVSLLFSTSAGILLAAGMQLFLGQGPVGGQLSVTSIVGSCLLIVASLEMSIVAWGVQVFSLDLGRRGKRYLRPRDAATEFSNWDRNFRGRYTGHYIDWRKYPVERTRSNIR